MSRTYRNLHRGCPPWTARERKITRIPHRNYVKIEDTYISRYMGHNETYSNERDGVFSHGDNAVYREWSTRHFRKLNREYINAVRKDLELTDYISSPSWKETKFIAWCVW